MRERDQLEDLDVGGRILKCMQLQYVGGGVDSIYLALVRERWHADVNMVMNIWVQ